MLLHRGSWFHSQPPSPLRQHWWAQRYRQGGGENGRETGKTSGERGRGRGRRNGVLPPVRHTHASQSSRGEDRASLHPTPWEKKKQGCRFCFVSYCFFFCKLLKPSKEKTCIIKTQSQPTYRGDRVRSEQREEKRRAQSGKRTERVFSTSDSGHGSDSGGGSSARWVQTLLHVFTTGRQVWRRSTWLVFKKKKKKKRALFVAVSSFDIKKYVFLSSMFKEKVLTWTWACCLTFSLG